jgi:hypothetical protein
MTESNCQGNVQVGVGVAPTGGRLKRAGNSLYLESAPNQRWPTGQPISFMFDRSVSCECRILSNHLALVKFSGSGQKCRAGCPQRDSGKDGRMPAFPGSQHKASWLTSLLRESGQPSLVSSSTKSKLALMID